MWEECGPCSIFACYTLTFALQLREKHGKTSVCVVEKCQLGTIHCVQMAVLRVARTSRSRSPCFEGNGSTFGQLNVCQAAELWGSLSQLTFS